MPNTNEVADETSKWLGIATVAITLVKSLKSIFSKNKKKKPIKKTE